MTTSRSDEGPPTAQRHVATRRQAIKKLATLGASVAPGLSKAGEKLPGGRPAGKAVSGLTLSAAPAAVLLVPEAQRTTPVWAYGGTVPGPLIESNQGELVDVRFENGLPEPSTVHWHGMRLPNAMDGVPYLTQAPVGPGDNFRYTFNAQDAGTYWYHPHLGTPEQVGRGLYGALIVHEPQPPAVDRDLVWIIDDWRLNRQARIVEDFNRWSDVTHAGRVGNTVTVNGRESYVESVRRGERLRLRLINTANARPVALDFGDHPHWLIALDGHPLAKASRVRPKQNVLLGPGQRADLIIDMTGADAGEKVFVADRFSPRRAHSVAWFQYEKTSPISVANRPAPHALAPNPVAEPAPADKQKVVIVMDGGMMRAPIVPSGEHTARRLRQRGGAREAYPAWSLNGRAHQSHGQDHPFEFTAERNRTVEITFENRSRFWHPMHLHGHAFRELTRNGRAVPLTPWRDTTMVAPRETLVVQFVADNPGDWLIHCHILEHHAGGMGTQFRVLA